MYSFIEDWNAIEFATSINDKKVIASKYNCTSNKIADIKKAIVQKAKETRSKVSEYSMEDVIWFNRLGVPESYTKLKSFLDDEPRLFVEYLMNLYEHKLDELNIRKYLSYNQRDISYHLSLQKQTYIKRYKNIKYYLEETSVSVKPDNTLKEKLIELLSDFKKRYLTNAAEVARKQYNNFSIIVKETTAKLAELNEKLVLINDQLIANDMNKFSVHEDVTYRTIANKADKVLRKLNTTKALLNSYTINTWTEHQVNNATNHFDRNVTILAERLLLEGLNTASLKIYNISTDPKLFQMHITDGTKNLYARSILAAECSEKMIMHYRFIITNANS